MEKRTECPQSLNMPPLPPPGSSIPVKRKVESSLWEDKEKSVSGPIANNEVASNARSDMPKGEYETGRVICEVCRKGVSFRDEDSGGFTLKHWDAHRLTCSSPPQSGPETVIYTPESTAEALANPPAKRRRAKRTEEERIEYLRADPYVAQFEAYRVLCASCDKWIRLRPNSTYCSIPWDAHRKSCLSKKICAKNIYSLEERFENDADVRKFDSERILCNKCDRWIPINSADQIQAVQTWQQHRSTCHRPPPNMAPAMEHPPRRLWSPSHFQSVPPSSMGPLATIAIASASPPPSARPSPPSPPPPAIGSPGHTVDIKPVIAQDGSVLVPSMTISTPHASAQHHGPHSPHPSHPHGTSPRPHFQQPRSPPPSFQRDLNPSNFQPAHESRRRNAEQRAATLRADPLIGEVEANRVFCSLCQKWVQLRQDSSYCAYPWLQHRGKCLARHQRRAQRLRKIEEMKAGRRLDENQDDEMLEGEDEYSIVISGDDEPESEEGVGSAVGNADDVGGEGSKHPGQDLRRDEYLRKVKRLGSSTEFPAAALSGVTKAGPTTEFGNAWREGHHHVRHRWEEAGAGRSWDDDEGQSGHGAMNLARESGTSKAARGLSAPMPARRGRPAGLADLDSPAGRKQFISASVDHLFRVTYEYFDDMTISSLLTYLNAAMPPDKHEDFDTAEVTKAAAALHDRGQIVFEGDILRRRLAE